MEIPNIKSDADLLVLLKYGDHAAYEEIYNRYNGLLYIFAYRRLKNREEAKDVIHELFLKLWVDRAAISDRYILAAYLYSSLRNRILNLISHYKVADRYHISLNSYISELSINNTDHLVRENELNAFIEKQISQLNPKMRKVFELSRKSNLSRKEIASLLAVSEETVKSRMQGALKVLKLRLGILLFSILILP